MWSIGLFEITSDDSGVKTIAAALALVGSILTASVTLIGVIVKYSIDDRNARLASIESARNFAMALESEKSNRIDIVIRAVDLLGENNQDAAEAEIGGSLLALSKLGEYDLALALLSQLWKENLVSIPIGEIVIADALQSDSERSQRTAAAVLAQNVDKIQEEMTSYWPFYDNKWPADLPAAVRLSLIVSAGEWLAVNLRLENPEFPPNPALVLYHALEDSNSAVSDIAASALRPLTEYLPQDSFVYLDNNETLSTADIVERIDKFQKSSISTIGRQIENRIREILFPADAES